MNPCTPAKHKTMHSAARIERSLFERGEFWGSFLVQIKCSTFVSSIFILLILLTVSVANYWTFINGRMLIFLLDRRGCDPFGFARLWRTDFLLQQHQDLKIAVPSRESPGIHVYPHSHEQFLH